MGWWHVGKSHLPGRWGRVWWPVFAGHQAIQNNLSISPVYLGLKHGLIPLIVLVLYGGYSGHGIASGKEVIGYPDPLPLCVTWSCEGLREKLASVSTTFL